MTPPRDPLFKRFLKWLIVPELRQGLRAQFTFHTAMEPAKHAKLTRPVMTGDESILNDLYVGYLNLFVEILDKHAPAHVEAILEWGLGHSTSYLYELAQEHDADLFVSIEHNEQYHNAFAHNFPPAPFFEARVEDLLGYSPAHGTPGENYATCVREYDRKFDIIFVDGRRRNECLLVASSIISDDGIVILHDANRTRYDFGINLFDTVEYYEETPPNPLRGFKVALRAVQ